MSGGTAGDGVVFKLNHDGSGHKVLHSFNESAVSPSGPSSGLVEGSDGALYGTTAAGGTNNAGTVFKLNRDGSAYAVFHSLTGGADGGGPYAGLIEGSDGGLYGTTLYGGSNNWGTVFKLNRVGSAHTVLRSFTGGADGASPYAGLIEGRDGLLYGTTFYGGSSNWGTVFKLNRDGTGYTVLLRFTGDADGRYPRAGLIEASDGLLYGTTVSGDSTVTIPPELPTNSFFGTVFKLNRDGSAHTVLHRFTGGADGANPYGGLIEGSDGALYGTTYRGGSLYRGTLFTLKRDGSAYTVLYSFEYDAGPYAGMIEGKDGLLYGASESGRYKSQGTVFKLKRDGTGYTVLHIFTGFFGGAADGSSPRAGLTAGRDGALYGTTFSGGIMNLGTVFKLFSSAPDVAVTGISFGNTGAQLSFAGGAAGQTYNLQSTTNLGLTNGWRLIGTNTAAIDGRFQFLDASTSNYSARFYRGVTP